MVATECNGSPVRHIVLKGRRWFSGADVLRALGLDVARRGASTFLRVVPRSEVKLVSADLLPAMFEGRRGYRMMNLVSEVGVEVLIDRFRGLRRSPG
ncbi:hypothetical protein E2F50_03520 [Rhizobium deserti]|uniref:Bro-N domain-containing protein n=1 Tax=Rhizobium deserti TaxID=2547961 RepID=A0A4R5UMV2_9HYPH|nr:hypothetical protein [Rhizobium deserti]TDK39206.1 hypothetical protein E2F50_03520 [Rhizobium deserti]